MLFALFAVARRIVSSPFGLGLRGIRENVKRMPAIGAPVATRLIAIYTVSAAMAGVAGGLLAQTTQFVGLDVFGFPRSADLMIMLVLGGAGRLYGGLVGTAVLMIAHHWLSDLNPIYWQFWLGLLLVVVVLYGRGGLLEEVFGRGWGLRHCGSSGRRSRRGCPRRCSPARTGWPSPPRRSGVRRTSGTRWPGR